MGYCSIYSDARATQLPLDASWRSSGYRSGRAATRRNRVLARVTSFFVKDVSEDSTPRLRLLPPIRADFDLAVYFADCMALYIAYIGGIYTCSHRSRSSVPCIDLIHVGRHHFLCYGTPQACMLAVLQPLYSCRI